MKLDSLLKIAGNPKTKRYWQILKRLHGGTEDTVKELKKTRDFGIYHNTKPENIKDILEKGLTPSITKFKTYPEKRVFFGDNSTSKFFGKSRFRLKYPQELSKKENYPKPSNFKKPLKLVPSKYIVEQAKEKKLPITKKFKDNIAAYGLKPLGMGNQPVITSKEIIKPNLLQFGN